MPGRRVGDEWRHIRISHKVIPHKSGVHRLACFALYKLLLLQVVRSPLDQELLSKALRSEFRQDAKLREFAAIRQSLTRGYQTLSLLETLRRYQRGTESELHHVSQVGEKDSRQQDLSQKVLKDESFVSVAASQSPAEKPVSVLTTRETSWTTHWRYSIKDFQSLVSSINVYLASLLLENPATSKFSTPAPRLVPYPGANKVLDRPFPLAKLAGGQGPRHVPKLVSASGFPFLRIKKPQPALISKIIKGKLKTKQRRIDQIAALEDNAIWAADEDEWDAKIDQELRTSPHAQNIDSKLDTNTFMSTTKSLIKELQRKINAEESKQHALADKMWKIVKAETALQQKEKLESQQMVEKSSKLSRRKQTVAGESAKK